VDTCSAALGELSAATCAALVEEEARRANAVSTGTMEWRAAAIVSLNDSGRTDMDSFNFLLLSCT
jgi:hypothetical protein